MYKTNLVDETPQRPPQPGNPGDADRPAQTLVSSLNFMDTIPLKHFSNLWRSLVLQLMKFKV